MLTRRRLLVAAGQLSGASLLTACGIRLSAGAFGGVGDGDGAVLTSRPEASPPRPPEGPPTIPGTHPLGLEAVRDALLHVPPTVLPGAAAPLVLTLHGAGGDAEAGLALLRPLAEERGLLLLAPASRGTTWDAIRGSYGPDAALIDRALARVFAAFAVDASRVAVAGFSDGASYALGLGLANGDLLRKIVAFSPGFVPPRGRREGAPLVFVSHGDADEVLPIDRTSGKIVPKLREDGYDVTFREFSGPHTVPSGIAREAVDWLG
ncbi:MAG: phospholipase [Modestobacter sp.]|nr:phospholipase [Modestobacter sp.]